MNGLATSVRRGDVDDASPALAFIAGRASRVVWKADERLMAMIASHFSGGTRQPVPRAGCPALLTNVDPPNSATACRNQGFDLGRAAHVGGEVAYRRAAGGDQPVAQVFDGVGVAEAVDDQIGALRGQRAGNALPDAGGGAGDKRSLVVEHGRFPVECWSG